MNPSRYFRLSYLVLAALLISGCDTGGEYNAPRTAPPEPEQKCPATSELPALLDAQEAMPLELKGDFMDAATAANSHDLFMPAFMLGDRLFETQFTAAQGGGANVGGGERYTRVPRADRQCPGEWATHKPDRATGPNAQSCLDCHNRPKDGAGSIAGNAQRDPLHSGKVDRFIQRNTPHLFGAGAVQRLGEEMTEDLQRISREAGVKACQESGQTIKAQLSTKTVDFGYIEVRCEGGKAVYDTSGVKGVSPDLIVRPFQWKKTVRTVRDFVLDAGHNEIGMQGVEIAGLGRDSDGDGVINELTVGQVSALTVYMAAQPRPTTKVELAEYGILTDDTAKAMKMAPASTEERDAVQHGKEVFSQIHCDTCHKPQLTLKDGLFTETGPDNHPVSFDLTRDQPDNLTDDGRRLGAFTEKDSDGNIVIRLFSDLKRHNMGPELAEAIDEPSADAPKGIGRSTFGTKELWGVGCTGPWMHDGRATTLTAAIRYHGGEGAASRTAFNNLDSASQKDLLKFLYDQVLYIREAGKDAAPDLEICEPKDDIE